MLSGARYYSSTQIASMRGQEPEQAPPEDIEKIDFVFTQKRELPKYSRLVDKTEIVEKHDYNLNIRRYVDNTPDPSRRMSKRTLSGVYLRRKCKQDKATFEVWRRRRDFVSARRPGYLAFLRSSQPSPLSKSPWRLILRCKERLPPTTTRWRPGGCGPR